MMWNLKLLIAAVTVTGILGAGSALYAYNKGMQSGRTEIQSLWDSEKIAMQQAQAAEMMKARQRESALQSLVARLRKEKTDEANRLAAEYQRTVDGLRNRPTERAGAGGVPEASSAGVGCTGEGLARPDAEFLVRYAHDAARLQSALHACQAAYSALTNE